MLNAPDTKSGSSGVSRDEHNTLNCVKCCPKNRQRVSLIQIQFSLLTLSILEKKGIKVMISRFNTERFSCNIAPLDLRYHSPSALRQEENLWGV